MHELCSPRGRPLWERKQNKTGDCENTNRTSEVIVRTQTEQDRLLWEHKQNKAHRVTYVHRVTLCQPITLSPLCYFICNRLLYVYHTTLSVTLLYAYHTTLCILRNFITTVLFYTYYITLCLSRYYMSIIVRFAFRIITCDQIHISNFNVTKYIYVTSLLPNTDT